MGTREELHRLIDSLADELLDQAAQRLAELDNPFVRALLSSAEDATVTLYRPVGQAELDLIAGSGYRAFPPRLPQQPIFYPVLNEDYATQIARDWNTKNAASGGVGDVARFAVRTAFLRQYEVHQVGSSVHQEYWIPAEELPAFYAALEGPIEVLARFPPAVDDMPAPGR